MGKRSRTEKDTETDEHDRTEDELPREETREGRVPTDEAPGHPGEGPEGDPEDDSGRRARVMRFAKRLMDRRELTTDTREILGSVLATSDKAKNEAVRMVAREVRSYLDALELKDDFKQLITSYSLEISLSLKPLEPVVANAPSSPLPQPEPEPKPKVKADKPKPVVDEADEDDE